MSIGFEPVTARFFRRVANKFRWPPSSWLHVSDLQLSMRYRFESTPVKTALTIHPLLPPAPAEWPAAPAGVAVSRDGTIDLSAQMDADGKLTWEVPPGKWTLLRFGHTSTGSVNVPAPPSGVGLECDKLSKDGAAAAFHGLMGRLVADNPSLTGQDKPLVATHIDSWKVGSQNWTPRMREEFQQRFGYDLLKFLPAFTSPHISYASRSRRYYVGKRCVCSGL